MPDVLGLAQHQPAQVGNANVDAVQRRRIHAGGLPTGHGLGEPRFNFHISQGGDSTCARPTFGCADVSALLKCRHRPPGAGYQWPDAERVSSLSRRIYLGARKPPVQQEVVGDL